MPTYIVQCVDRRDASPYRVTVEAGGTIEALEIAAGQGHVCSHAVSLASMAVPTRPESDQPGTAPPREGMLMPPEYPPPPARALMPGSVEDRLERIEAECRRTARATEALSEVLTRASIIRDPTSPIAWGIVYGFLLWIVLPIVIIGGGLLLLFWTGVIFR